jgi:hypothetical protein
MTDITINSLADFRKSRNAYRQFLKEQIAVNKTKADAVDLFLFNGSKPYYQPEIRSRVEKLGDKAFVRSDIINLMVEENFLDNKEASMMVGELNDEYVLLLYKYFPAFFKEYKNYKNLYDGKQFARKFIEYLDEKDYVKIPEPEPQPTNEGTAKEPSSKRVKVEERRSKRTRGTGTSIKIDKGIKPTPSYHQFGNKIINKSKLDKNILMMRYKNGINISKHPTKSVSRVFANVIRNMLLGKNPSYDDLDKLNQEEKTYLHEICSYCHVIDRFTIPTPNKNNDEQENDRFSLLVGQLKAGNNSKEMIKELKQLLIKFRTKRKLPIQEINEILMTLIEMGF